MGLLNLKQNKFLRNTAVVPNSIYDYEMSFFNGGDEGAINTSVKLCDVPVGYTVVKVTLLNTTDFTAIGATGNPSVSLTINDDTTANTSRHTVKAAATALTLGVSTVLTLIDGTSDDVYTNAQAVNNVLQMNITPYSGATKGLNGAAGKLAVRVEMTPV